MIVKPVILDVSEWQVPDKINYDQLAKGISGVIVRVQFGSLYKDKHYQTHIKEFQKRGIPVAVYAWVRGTSKQDMVMEARDFWKRAKDFQPVFWWLDVEEQSMADMRGGCEAYRKELKRLGAKKVGAYIANHLYAKFNLDVSKFDGIWIPTYGANNGGYYGANPTATKKYDIHQYTSNGKLPGYHGPLDLNRIANRSFAYFFGEKELGSGNQEKPSAAQKPQTTGGLATMKTFTLKHDVYLRKAAKTSAGAIALLKKGQQVKINDVIFAGGFLWGVQPRKGSEKGYIAMGELKAYGDVV